MKVLLYGINYSPELTGIGKYSGEMAAWLAARGHEIRVVTAPPYYPKWQVAGEYSRFKIHTVTEAGVRVTRCPLYVPKHPSATKRIAHLSSFAISSFFPVLMQARWKPDLIILVVPTLFCALPVFVLGAISGARRLIHIQDYEIDALFGLGLAKVAGLRRLVFWFERVILRSFEYVSTISQGMLIRAQSKGVDAERLILFPNWSEVERFQNASRSEELLAGLGLDPAKKTILYSGNLGEKQGLENMVETAEQLQHNQGIQFLMVGDGAARGRLVELVESKGLSNFYFAPLQPYESLPTLLASADVHLVIQKRGAADAVLPSKLTNILAVGGQSVITADPDTTLGYLCGHYPGIAECVEPESVSALIDGIERVLEKPAKNDIALTYARKNLDKDAILKAFISNFDC